MKASPSQQADLLSLSNLDLEITRTRVALSGLTSGEAFSELRSAQRDAASALIDSRNQLDSVELELKRAEADLALVEQRIEKDNLRLNQTSSSKDAQGIQAELETLKKNFLMKKLGLSGGPKLDEAISAVIDTYGKSERKKYRAVVYYMLTKHFGKESVYNK